MAEGTHETPEEIQNESIQNKATEQKTSVGETLANAAARVDGALAPVAGRVGPQTQAEYAQQRKRDRNAYLDRQAGTAVAKYQAPSVTEQQVQALEAQKAQAYGDYTTLVALAQNPLEGVTPPTTQQLEQAQKAYVQAEYNLDKLKPENRNLTLKVATLAYKANKLKKEFQALEHKESLTEVEQQKMTSLQLAYQATLFATVKEKLRTGNLVTAQEVEDLQQVQEGLLEELQEAEQAVLQAPEGNDTQQRADLEELRASYKEITTQLGAIERSNAVVNAKQALSAKVQEVKGAELIAAKRLPVPFMQMYKTTTVQELQAQQQDILKSLKSLGVTTDFTKEGAVNTLRKELKTANSFDLIAQELEQIKQTQGRDSKAFIEKRKELGIAKLKQRYVQNNDRRYYLSKARKDLAPLIAQKDQAKKAQQEYKLHSPERSDYTVETAYALSAQIAKDEFKLANDFTQVDPAIDPKLEAKYEALAKKTQQVLQKLGEDSYAYKAVRAKLDQAIEQRREQQPMKALEMQIDADKDVLEVKQERIRNSRELSAHNAMYHLERGVADGAPVIGNLATKAATSVADAAKNITKENVKSLPGKAIDGLKGLFKSKNPNQEKVYSLRNAGANTKQAFRNFIQDFRWGDVWKGIVATVTYPFKPAIKSKDGKAVERTSGLEKASRFVEKTFHKDGKSPKIDRYAKAHKAAQQLSGDSLWAKSTAESQAKKLADKGADSTKGIGIGPSALTLQTQGNRSEFFREIRNTGANVLAAGSYAKNLYRELQKDPENTPVKATGVSTSLQAQRKAKQLFTKERQSGELLMPYATNLKGEVGRSMHLSVLDVVTHTLVSPVRAAIKAFSLGATDQKAWQNKEQQDFQTELAGIAKEKGFEGLATEIELADQPSKERLQRSRVESLVRGFGMGIKDVFWGASNDANLDVDQLQKDTLGANTKMNSEALANSKDRSYKLGRRIGMIASVGSVLALGISTGGLGFLAVAVTGVLVGAVRVVMTRSKLAARNSKVRDVYQERINEKWNQQQIQNDKGVGNGMQLFTEEQIASSKRPMSHQEVIVAKEYLQRRGLSNDQILQTLNKTYEVSGAQRYMLIHANMRPEDVDKAIAQGKVPELEEGATSIDPSLQTSQNPPVPSVAPSTTSDDALSVKSDTRSVAPEASQQATTAPEHGLGAMVNSTAIPTERSVLAKQQTVTKAMAQGKDGEKQQTVVADNAPKSRRKRSSGQKTTSK